MSKFAIIETGGKQYRVEEGQVFTTEKLGKKEGSKVSFDKVLMLSDGKKTEVGEPYIKGAKVEATLESEKKGKKVTGMKFKNKTGGPIKYGHRKIEARLKVTKI